MNSNKQLNTHTQAGIHVASAGDLRRKQAHALAQRRRKADYTTSGAGFSFALRHVWRRILNFSCCARHWAYCERLNFLIRLKKIQEETLRPKLVH